MHASVLKLDRITLPVVMKENQCWALHDRILTTRTIFLSGFCSRFSRMTFTLVLYNCAGFH